jgi:hypothetical protein
VPLVWGGKTCTVNKYIHVYPNVGGKGEFLDGQFVFVLSFAKKGKSHPSITSKGKGCCDQLINIGSSTVSISGSEISRFNS